MAAKGPTPIQERELTGLKYLSRISSLLERLRPAGCERDKAGNRTLFMRKFDHIHVSKEMHSEPHRSDPDRGS